ncbi:MFS transporter [Haloferax denitrificans]|uniref:Major facilitator superfamily protein n=1 Tax=Haloferax denitrificans ATCC 35960 TaxID=662478 RepID=M0JGV2_9EURY|nr:MFS transporter [Haloferax denitrificans]EMA06910.1 major facilitator superfamily protein [Haloferax denitrificans ATCC 35960]
MKHPDWFVSPERGVYDGWFVVLASFLGTVAVFGVSYSFSVFFTRLLNEFSRSGGSTSLVFALQTFVMCSGAAVFAEVFDRISVVRTWILGTTLFGVGLLGASFSNSLFMLTLSYGVVAALGMSFIYVVSSTTITRWFAGRRAFASGLASSGIGVGMLGISPLSRHLIAVEGWRKAYLVIVVLVLVLLLIGGLLLKHTGRAPTDKTRTTSQNKWRTIWPVVKSPPFVLIFCGWLLIYVPVYAALAHLVPFVASQPSLTASTGAWALGAFGVSASLTRLLIGPLADRVGRMELFVAASGLASITIAFLPVVSDTLGVGIFAATFGIAYGGNGALLAPVLADQYGTNDIDGLFAVVSISFAIAGLVAPPLTSILQAEIGSYWIPFTGGGVLGCIGAGLSYFGFDIDE